jgi:hypothetical protein
MRTYYSQPVLMHSVLSADTDTRGFCSAAGVRRQRRRSDSSGVRQCGVQYYRYAVVWGMLEAAPGSSIRDPASVGLVGILPHQSLAAGVA